MVIIETLEGLGNSALSYLPNIAVAIILLLIGWLIGWVVSKVSRKILDLVKIDHYIAHEGKVHFSLRQILPIVFSWYVYFIFITAAVDALSIPALTQAMGNIRDFIPGLIGAIFVIIAGYAIGEYVRRRVESADVMYSDVIGKGLFFLVMYIAVATALPLVNIDSTLISNILLVIIGSAGAGMAIALGLGLKDEVAGMAKKYAKKWK